MAKGFKHGAGGGTSLNFKVVGGTSAPSNLKGNTVWVNTDVPIGSWYFSAEEPDGSKISVPNLDDPWVLKVTQKLSDGDILNFTIPATVNDAFEAIRIIDGSSSAYFVRTLEGTAHGAWSSGTKASVRISNNRSPVGNWGDDGGTAYLINYGSWTHDEGMVWISTGTSSTAEFNALKKNGIMVYPLSAKQYINGAWVTKTAKIYQNGAWSEIGTEVYLFNMGDQCTALTGGWTNSGYTVDGYASSSVCGLNGNGWLYCTGKTGAHGAIGTAIPVDLTYFSTLVFKGYTSANTESSRVYVCRTKDVTGSAVAGVLLHLADSVVSVDISNLTGSYYILFGASANSSATSYCSHVYLAY